MKSISFRTQSQRLVWENIIKQEIVDGMWRNSTMHNQKIFANAQTNVSKKVGTDIPLFETRFDLIKDKFLFDKGWIIIAATRISIIYACKGVHRIPKSIIELIEHIIIIDPDDHNKDYRRSQVRSVNEIFYRVSKYSSHGKERFERLLEDAKAKGFVFEGIVEALKIDVFNKTDLNKDMLDMMKILKTPKSKF